MTPLERQLIINLKAVALTLRDSAALAESAVQDTPANVVLSIHLGSVRGIADDILRTLPKEKP
jgi:hypothetical protein